ncbi:MAG: hypothetical protein ACRCYQ_15975 [Nocardioides sp.]
MPTSFTLSQAARSVPATAILALGIQPAAVATTDLESPRAASESPADPRLVDAGPVAEESSPPAPDEDQTASPEPTSPPASGPADPERSVPAAPTPAPEPDRDLWRGHAPSPPDVGLPHVGLSGSVAPTAGVGILLMLTGFWLVRRQRGG